MAKIIHTADLHLRADEKVYCYAVLDEIIELAKTEKADFLVIAGDLFDSFADFEALRKEVRHKLFHLHEAGCRVIYIPGNHETRGAPADLSAYSLDPVQFYARGPFVFFEAAGVEFICVPHAENYDGYRDWKVPPKREGVTRVAVLHALNSTIYTGPDEEADSKTGVIEDDFFRRFSVDYAALGHVHAGRQQRLGGATACYPGSPRVWRAHPKEAGLKTVCVVETGGAPVTTRLAEIRAAGQYKEYTLPLGPDGEPGLPEIQKIEAGLTGRDLVCVKLTGLVENEPASEAAAAALRERLLKRARAASVELETTVAEALYSSELTKSFLAELEALRPEDETGAEYRRWLLARQYGLLEIAERSGEDK
ncbi:MAG: DNA repair exonuclease [Elusimicrobiales bacterium]|nr:DNA repair exonuclease [Elusimicrobiales bacterium]